MLQTRPHLFLTSILLACVLATAAAQEPGGNGEAPPEQPPAPEREGPKSPRELMVELRQRIGAFKDSKNEEDLVKAGQLFDLDDIPSSDRDQIGAIAARDLHEIDNRLERLRWVPTIPDTDSPYKISTEYGELEFVRDEYSVWYFSRNTLEGVSAMSVAVGQALPLHRHAVRIPLPSSLTTHVRDRVPSSWRHRGFLLEHWQWLGLLALIFAGLILNLITTSIIRLGERLFLARSGVDAQTVRDSMARPIGQLIMAAIWLGGVRFLLLPATIHVVLMATARLVTMVATVWAVWRLVDLITGVLLVRAQATATRMDDQLVPLVRRTLKIFVAVAGGLWIASTLDLDIGTLMATLGLGGLAFALAAKDTVSNLFGSLTILMDRPFQIGDWIRSGDVEGTVETVGFRSVRIRTFYNSVITLPNSALITASVDNLGVRQYRRIKETIGVTYATPTVKLYAFIEGIRELIRQHPYTRKDYYQVYLNRLSASSLDILLYAFVECPDWSTELREKERLLMDTLRLAEELGIELAFPTQQVQLLQVEAEQHLEAPPSPGDGEEHGRQLARQLVARYTGGGVPPPVVIAEKAGEDDAEGEGSDGVT